VLPLLDPAGAGEESCAALKMPVPEAPWSAARRGGPHPMALRAFSWFLGARQRTGMSDCPENTRSEILRSSKVRSFPRKREATQVGPRFRGGDEGVTLISVVGRRPMDTRNDSTGRVVTQTPRVRAVHSFQGWKCFKLFLASSKLGNSRSAF